MGILNLTEDSFFDGGKYNSLEKALVQSEKILSEGAKILDIGAASSRPGAESISPEDELKKLIPFVEKVKSKFPDAVLSIDTFHSKVARECIEAGAHIINDISGGQFDENMFDTIAELNVPYILMHIQGNPQNMQIAPSYENVVLDIANYFNEKIDILKKKGVKDIIIDPGFGFGKTIEDNYDILNNLNHFKMLNKCILAGISRKSMIYKPLNIEPKDTLNATSALHIIALERGATILRVHDVKEAFECIQLHQMLEA